jgi:sugar phosphate permease
LTRLLQRAPRWASSSGRLDERIRLGLLLAVVVGAASVLFPLLSTLAPLIRADLSLSRFQVGTLATTFFGVAALVSLLVGRAVDRLGSRRILSGTLVVTAAALMGIALSRSYAMILAFTVLAGVALSASNPVTNAVIVSAVRPGERGTVMGLKHAGVPATGALMSLVLPAAAVAFGWRGVVLATAAVVLALARAVAGAGSDARERAVAGPGDRVPLGLAWIGGYALLMGAAGGATTLYLPLYGYEALGLSVAVAGAAAAAGQVTAIASRIVWTRTSERAQTVGRPLAAVSLCALVALVPLVAAETLGAALFWLAAIAIGAGMLGWTPIAMLAAIRLAEPVQAGRASGVVVAGFYSGVMIGPALFGHIVDATGGYASAWLAAGGGFVAAAALALCCGSAR